MQSPWMIGILLLAALSCAAAEPPGPAGEDFLRVALSPERAPAADEDLWLEVFAGALPPQASLEIRDAAGAKVGAVAPYGRESREQGSSYRVPLPAALQHGEPFELRVQLLVSGKARRPTGEELREIRLVYVAVAE